MSSTPAPGFGRITEIDRLPAYRQEDAAAEDEDRFVWDLSNNESALPPLPAVAEAVRQGGLHTNQYPDPTAGSLVRALSRHFGIDTRKVLVGPGSAGVLQQLLLSLCSDGDEVIHALPCFDAYPLLIAVAGARRLPVPLTELGEHDLPEILARVTPRTRVVVLCSPHNPSGSRLPDTDLREFLADLPRHVTVVLDEAYIEFDEAKEPRDLDILRRDPRVVLLRTFSKAYGLAGLRVGYALAAPDILERARKTAIPFSVTRTAELAAIVSLEQQDALAERMAHTRKLRTDLHAALDAEGLSPLPSCGNFIWIPLGSSAESFAATAQGAGIKVRVYPGQGVRISVGCESAHRHLLEAVRHRVSALSQGQVAHRLR
ncbi:aminotransferase class I/II-fold pyridoxal phosphate-dependent enzyme [Streptomyces sp. NRRL F-5135]|uniref:aminotransferase class I/II-fold pyridoxal phosphate-dependent enzyme n=1 Tax=Streptomyces sp. NRRL F-5135 TaxID=1463858 RepID=UPI0004C87E94|nr:aminotransferase class I/II-fold pyridoxal phosphate-dependent enzyme [Streptomyces sp. NRRL F-5135]